MTYSLTWLPEVLERAGLKVAETPDWRTRGRAEMGPVKGVICHHTGTLRGGNMPTLDVLIKGRSDLTGPLCHLGLGRDGTFYVVAAGRANHAGPGSWETITTGNANFIGIEAENSGSGDWPDVQLDAYRRGVAAILKQVGTGANMVCGHKEYAPGRKVDPSFDMPTFRSEVAELLSGKTPPPPIAAKDVKSRSTLRRGMRGDEVCALQRRLNLQDDAIFGGATEAQVRVWQRAHDLTSDGIFGPQSWDMLDAQPAQPDPASISQASIPTPATASWVVQQIDPALMAIAFPANTAAELKLWIDPLRQACLTYEITEERSFCGFFSNITVESGSLTTLAEGLNYSVDGLIKTFGTDRISEADARRLGRKQGEAALSIERQQGIADIVYGGTWGRENLGNTEPDDGWAYRGYGPIQITGRDNCQRFADSLDKPIDYVPGYLRTRVGGCMAAGWYWKSRKFDPATASPEAMRKAVNPKMLGLDAFQRCFAQLSAELGRRRANP